MHTLWITVLGFLFIFVATALGAAVVFFFKGDIPKNLNAFFLGLAAGVMTAASVWSLLLPALSQAQSRFGSFAFFPAVLGISVGGFFLVILEKIIATDEKNVAINKGKRLFLAVTLHNIPEGLAVGFAFGAAASLGEKAAYISAALLALGIGVQNFPEGMAVALPLKTSFNSRKRAFLWGAASGLPEPVFAILGYFLVAWLKVAQPWLLSFAAGAMLFVVFDDLTPDAKAADKGLWGTFGGLLGFVFMMTLDVVFGA